MMELNVVGRHRRWKSPNWVLKKETNVAWWRGMGKIS